MNSIENQGDFNERWNLTQDEQSKFQEFKNRLLIAVEHTLGSSGYNLYEVAELFCYRHGIHFPSELPYDSEDRVVLRGTPIYQRLSNANNVPEITKVLESLFSSLPGQSYYEASINLEKLVKDAQKCTGVHYFRTKRVEGWVLFYPAGAKLLDQAVIDPVLDWLKEYPEVAKHFEQALQDHASKDEGKRRHVLDDLRFSLEQLLRVILGNNERLEKQREPLLKWLNSRGVNQEAINMFNTLVIQFSQYQNEAVKHNDKSLAVEAEFLIYLTGTFMRFILQLNNMKPADSGTS